MLLLFIYLIFKITAADGHKRLLLKNVCVCVRLRYIFLPTTIRLNTNPFFTAFCWTWFGNVTMPTYFWEGQ